MAITWSDLFNNGSIIALNTSQWRARIKLKASDLGIEATEDVNTALALGAFRLAPAKAFDDILEPSRAAARAIEQSSINFAMIRGSRFVPSNKLPQLQSDLAFYKDRFNEAVAKFLENYDDMRESVMPIIERALEKAAKSLPDAVTAMERIRAEYPTREEAATQFRMVWNIYAISAPRNAGVAQAAEEEAANVKSIIGGMVKELHAEITEKLSSILALVAKGGKLPEKSIKSAQEVLDRVESMNILGDYELSQQIGAARKLLSSVDPKEVSQGFVNGLVEIQTALGVSVEQAIADAEASLTGLGRRKISLPAFDAEAAGL